MVEIGFRCFTDLDAAPSVQHLHQPDKTQDRPRPLFTYVVERLDRHDDYIA